MIFGIRMLHSSHTLFIGLAVALLPLAGTSCGFQTTPQPGGSESQSDTDPSSSSQSSDSGGKGDIFGEDNRMEYFKAPENSVLRRVSDAVAVLVKQNVVKSDGPSTVVLDHPEHDSFRERKGVCPSVPYSHQPSPGDCTGFLVKNDVIVTAGHCVETQQQCDNTRFVFDYRYASPQAAESGTKPRISRSNVYKCDNLIESVPQTRDKKRDYGVIRLNRKVTDRTPLTYRTVGKVKASTPLGLVGHPFGMPQKLTPGGTIIDNSGEKNVYFSLDGFYGNSGSPVINRLTGRVEAVFTGGHKSFSRAICDNGEDGWELARCKEADRGDFVCGGTYGTRMTVFSDLIPE